MSYSINRIITPSTLQIPGGLRPGKQILLRGRVTHNHDYFCINVREADGGGDILFHFNPRQEDEVVVRNTFSGGEWGEEERDKPHFPFGSGKSFLLRIEIAEDGYHTYVQGNPFINYSHRIDPSKGMFLELSEGAEYYDVTFQDKDDTPYRTEIPGRMQIGKAVRLRGATRGSEGFNVNFSCDCENESIAFHFNPRPSDGTVVMNANIGGWGDEERDFEGDFPFDNDQYFDIIFVCTAEKYHVYVNENHFADFNHRLDFADATHLHILGDVDIAELEFLEPVDDDFVKEIPSGLEKGDVLLFRGFMRPESEWFAINLHYGLTTDSDVALHFNPRIDQGQVVFNSRTDDSWAEEERIDIPQCIADRKPFEIKIVTKSKKFKVYVNGSKVKKFESRGEIENIKGINVNSGAYIFQVKLERKLIIAAVVLLESEHTRQHVSFGKSHSRKRDGIVVTTFGTYRLSSVKRIFRNGQQTHDGVRKIKEKMVTSSSIGTLDLVASLWTATRNQEKQTDSIWVFSASMEDKNEEKPVLERIPGGIIPGSWIVIHGMPKKKCDRFHINLKCGDDPESNVAFHFNPRFGEEHCTVRNTYVEGDWQEEEREEDSFPFEKKDTFEVVIKVMEEKFMTYVNGDRYIDFNHRLPLDSICHLEMDGLAEFYETEFL